MRGIEATHYLLEVELLRDRVPSFDKYPYCLPAVRKLRKLTLHPAVTFIIGENGSGKSTLLEAIAVAWGLNAEGGSANFRFGTRASHSPLHEQLRLKRGVRRARDGFFFRAESFFNVATEIERLDEDAGAGGPIIAHYGGRPLHEQSHGESFMALLMNRFGGRGLYILDEPEAALSPRRQLAALARMHQLVAAESQFIIATHSPILLAYPGATIYELAGDTLRKAAYTDTEHYTLTKAFLNKHEKLLAELFEEDAPPDASA